MAAVRMSVNYAEFLKEIYFMKQTNGELKGMARQMLLGRYQVPMLAMLLS